MRIIFVSLITIKTLMIMTKYFFEKNENGCYEIVRITPENKDYCYAYNTQEEAIKSVFYIY